MDRVNGWRLLTEDAVTGSAGLAVDETLTAAVGEGASAPTLRLYTYRPCALVGRFQNVHNELHLDECSELGIPVNRRPTGGGAIVMGPDQLGVALVLPAPAEAGFPRAREMMARFAEGLVGGLGRLGVRTAFKGKNDLEVEGRKIAGLGIFRHPAGGVLYHASLLVDLDVGFMLRVLNTPFEKITDKEIGMVEGRTSTVRKETRRDVSLEEVRGKVGEGFAGAFGVRLEPGELTPEEKAGAGELEREKYLGDDWVFQTLDVTDSFGAAKVKTPAGLLDIRVTLAGKMIKAVFVAGDFFADEGAVAALEAGLRWHVAEPNALRETVATVFTERSDGLAGIPREALLQGITSSVLQATKAGGGELSAIYGCFVNPDG